MPTFLYFVPIEVSTGNKYTMVATIYFYCRLCRGWVAWAVTLPVMVAVMDMESPKTRAHFANRQDGCTGVVDLRVPHWKCSSLSECDYPSMYRLSQSTNLTVILKLCYSEKTNNIFVIKQLYCCK